MTTNKYNYIKIALWDDLLIVTSVHVCVLGLGAYGHFLCTLKVSYVWLVTTHIYVACHISYCKFCINTFRVNVIIYNMTPCPLFKA